MKSDALVGGRQPLAATQFKHLEQRPIPSQVYQLSVIERYGVIEMDA